MLDHCLLRQFVLQKLIALKFYFPEAIFTICKILIIWTASWQVCLVSHRICTLSWKVAKKWLYLKMFFRVSRYGMIKLVFMIIAIEATATTHKEKLFKRREVSLSSLDKDSSTTISTYNHLKLVFSDLTGYNFLLSAANTIIITIV